VLPDGQELSLPMLPQRADDWQAILMHVSSSADFYARSGRSRSRIGHLHVTMTPQIVSANVRITPPAYTKRAPVVGPIPKQGIVGLAGTQVDFSVTSNRPLRKGRLSVRFRDGSQQEIELTPGLADAKPNDDASDTVHGSMPLAKPGNFELSVFDADGLESLDHVSGAVTITADQRPVIRIIEPKPLSLATPDVRLAVEIAAEDDYGLTSLQLFRSLNGSSATALPCVVDGGPTQNAVVELPLDRYGLAAGDEIRLFARAEDNDPAGAKGAESPVTVVRIISTEQFQQMLLQQEGAESITAKYQAANRYLEKLADAIQAAQEAADAAAARPGSPEAQRELQQKLAAAKRAADAAAKSMRQLSEQPLPIDVDRELAERLAKMAEQTRKAAEQLGKLAQSQGGQRELTAEEQQSLKKLAEKLAGRRDQLAKQAIEPLERLQQAMPLLVDQQRFAALAAQQRDLAQRLESLRSSSKADDPAVQRRVAELEAEQQQLRESLDTLLEDIAAHADALPDVPDLEKLRMTALEFVDAVQESEAMSSMSAAQKELLLGSFPEAIDQARSAADILESFLSKCNSMGDSACKSCQLAFNPSAGAPPLGNSLQQLLAMMGAKPGTGGNPGMGFGFGAGGGYSVRMPGPQNIGMYGSLPLSAARSGRGQSDRRSHGFATRGVESPQRTGDAEGNPANEGSAAGQAASSVPPQYRSQVAEYFRKLAEQLGDQP
jgi:Domain of unknown function (DUF4175)